MAVTEYKTVEATTVAELNALVTAAIGDGFQPYGQPISRDTPNSEYDVIVQALIKGSPPNPQDADLSAITDRLEALELTVDTEETGLAALVAAHEATLNTETTGLVDVVADHETRIQTLESP